MLVGLDARLDGAGGGRPTQLSLQKLGVVLLPIHNNFVILCLLNVNAIHYCLNVEGDKCWAIGH